MMYCEVARVLDVCRGIQTPIAFNLSLRCIAMLRAAGMVHVCLLLRSTHDMRTAVVIFGTGSPLASRRMLYSATIASMEDIGDGNTVTFKQ